MAMRLNPNIEGIPAPERVARLPIGPNGYYVPWFVPWVDGKPEFRAMSAAKWNYATRVGACWVCGELHDRAKAFVVGPMCTVNRVSAEPPSHVDCAEYAVRACPFLSRPHMTRREGGLPAGCGTLDGAPGVAIDRNPGVTAVWFVSVERPRTFKVDKGHLFDIGQPFRVTWWREGRAATRAEVEAAVESGLPELVRLTEGEEALADLRRAVVRAKHWFPAG